jgi:ketosteroid isomerase-like protein
MGMSANRTILSEAYRQWDSSKAADNKCWLAIVADDVSFGSSAEGEASLPFAGPHKGRAELNRYFEGLLGDWSMLHYTVHDYIEQGDKIVALVTTAWRNKKTGKPFEVAKADAWTFKNGKVAAFFEYYDTAKLARAAS